MLSSLIGKELLLVFVGGFVRFTVICILSLVIRVGGIIGSESRCCLDKFKKV